MLRVYEAWQSANGLVTACALAERFAQVRNDPDFGPDAKLLYRFEAHTLEEASAIHCLRMGWRPYEPVGESKPCPHCGAQVYPEGSGECWQCGKVS